MVAKEGAAPLGHVARGGRARQGVQPAVALAGALHLREALSRALWEPCPGRGPAAGPPHAGSQKRGRGPAAELPWTPGLGVGEAPSPLSWLGGPPGPYASSLSPTLRREGHGSVTSGSLLALTGTREPWAGSCSRPVSRWKAPVVLLAPLTSEMR